MVLVAIDADPNEDAAKVKEHVTRYRLKGRFAIAPQVMTNALVDKFGPDIIAPPTAPVVLISADQTQARLLPRGVKSVAELKAAIEKVR